MLGRAVQRKFATHIADSSPTHTTQSYVIILATFKNVYSKSQNTSVSSKKEMSTAPRHGLNASSKVMFLISRLHIGTVSPRDPQLDGYPITYQSERL